MQECAISAINISAGYSDATIIHGESLQAEPASLTAIVGPNGCGKSTFLKALCGLTRLSGGSVQIAGRDIGGYRPAELAKRLGYLPQGPIAPEGLRVRELVAQGRYPYQTFLNRWSAEDEDAVRGAMAAADVAEFADRPVTGLSGGQRQRCWIAMVLAQDTDILILDEPTTFLDLRVQVDLMTILAEFAHGRGRTVVVVLHELNVAAAFADRLVMMKDGRFIASGTVEEVFSRRQLQRAFGFDAAVLEVPENARPICMPLLRGTRG